MSEDESNMTNKYFIKTRQVDYDSPERYLYEFFKHPGYMKFRRQFYKYSEQAKSSETSFKKVRVGKFKKEKTLFLEIDKTILLLSPERIKHCPVVSQVFTHVI
jgi:type IV secretory pathway VirB4 component